MTEVDTSTGFDLCVAFDQAGVRPSERKVRLLSVACCRSMWDVLSDQQARQAVEVAERFADGAADEDERRAALHQLLKLNGSANSTETFGPLDLSPPQVVAALAIRRADDFLFDFTGRCIAHGELATGENLFRLHEACRAFDWTRPTPASPGSGRWPSICRRVGDVWAAANGRDGPTRLRAMEAWVQERTGLAKDIFGPAKFHFGTFDSAWRSADSVAVARAIYEDRAFDRLPILADALMDAGCADEAILDHCRSAGPHVRGCWVVDLVLGKE